ncbi:tetratricopeptide repeat protein [Glycomyces sp. NPDC048151]|uniref:tetratricopeptide repeat protein n=1 Tax=Glycomyces sp. NPDC048151 TaxID=3364002 RepID=UPI00371CF826
MFSTWNAESEVASLEDKFCSYTLFSPIGDIPDGLLSEHTDGHESLAMGAPLWEAAAKGRAGDWGRCIPAFRKVHTEDERWDIPYVWFARFLDDQGRGDAAVKLLRNAVTICRRKSVLLDTAGELSLFSGRARQGLHLFAQSIAANPKVPSLEDTGRLYLYCRMAVIFEALGDTAGAAWADGLQHFTYIDDQGQREIRSAIERADIMERSLMFEEAPQISAALRRYF